MQEGAHINRSLLALGNCINALSEKGGGRAQYVNFRDSKLTRLLKVRAPGRVCMRAQCTHAPHTHMRVPAHAYVCYVHASAQLCMPCTRAHMYVYVMHVSAVRMRALHAVCVCVCECAHVCVCCSCGWLHLQDLPDWFEASTRVFRALSGTSEGRKHGGSHR